ncbi:MAG TPA: hypothetical protein VEO74_13970, partial [Thermoanaerobaculia bacterium]|nr:hypothetical protein [Thermoanaerobaculia bacterium]
FGSGLGVKPLLTANGDAFFALSSSTLVKLDGAGHTLRKTWVSDTPMDNAGLLFVGAELLLARRTAPSYVVDPETLALRPIDTTFPFPSVMASNGSTIVLVEQGTRTTVYDRGGSVISTPQTLLVPSSQGVGAVATDGIGYLVVWNDGVRLRTLLLDANGRQRWNNDFSDLDSPGLVPIPHFVVWGGTKYLVVWRDGRNLYARLATPEGRAEGNAVVLDSSDPYLTGAAWDGRDFLIAFNSKVARVGTNGMLLEPPRTIETAPGRAAFLTVLASNGRATLAVWQERCSCGECYDSRIGVPGAVSSLPFGAEERDGVIQAGVVAATEEAGVVAYQDQSFTSKVRIAFVPSRGTSVDVPPSNGSQSLPAMATDGTSFLVAWIDNDCERHVRAAIMNAGGRFGAPLQLSNEEVAASPPAVTWNGSEYAVVWKSAYGTQLVGLRLTRSGAPIGTPLNVTSGDAFTPSIAWTGSGYIVGWRYAQTYRIVRLSPDLHPVAGELTLGPAQYGNVASDGSEAVAFFRVDGDLQMVRIDAGGNATAAKAIAISPPTFNEPSVVAHNGEWLVTGTSSSGGRVSRITRTGDVVQTVEILGGDERLELLRSRIAATPSCVVVTAETWNPPRRIMVRVAQPQPPRRRAAR